MLIFLALLSHDFPIGPTIFAIFVDRGLDFSSAQELEGCVLPGSAPIAATVPPLRRQ